MDDGWWRSRESGIGIIIDNKVEVEVDVGRELVFVKIVSYWALSSLWNTMGTKYASHFRSEGGGGYTSSNKYS